MMSLVSAVATLLLSATYIPQSYAQSSETLTVDLIQHPLGNGSFVGMVQFGGLTIDQVKILNVSYWTTSAQGGELFVYDGKDMTNTQTFAATVQGNNTVTYTLGRVIDCITLVVNNDSTITTSTTAWNETNHIGVLYFFVEGQIIPSVIYDADNLFTCNKTGDSNAQLWATCPVNVVNNVYQYDTCDQKLSMPSADALEQVSGSGSQTTGTTSSTSSNQKSSANALYSATSPLLVAAVALTLSVLM